MRLLETVFCLLLVKVSLQEKESVGCGIQKIKTRDLIMHGYDTYPGQFPWHVAIFHRKSITTTRYACGGSLISHFFVLTSAHCTKDDNFYAMNPQRVYVLMGIHNLNSVGKTSQQHSVFVIHTVPPEGRWANLRNDLALLELASRVEYTDYIQPICLSSVEMNNRISGVVAGWGRTENERISETLKAVRISIVSHMDCLASDRVTFGGLLDAGMVCAGYLNSTGVSSGDSGGGLTMDWCFMGLCSWSLVGVVSFAPGNHDGTVKSSSYAAFTSIRVYLPWIEKITRLEFEEQRYYGVCGQQQDDSGRAQWPWHGILVSKTMKFKENPIGVTILTDTFVLTSMSGYRLFKRDSIQQIVVQVGLPSYQKADKFSQEFQIEQAYTNKTMDPPSDKTIILLKLAGSINFSKYVQPICLWPAEDNAFHKVVGRTGYVASYGKYSKGAKLREFEVTIVPKAECVAFDNYKEIYQDSVTFCVKTTDNCCDLDAGSGLYLRQGNNWYLRGIVMTSAKSSNYHMFIDVAYYSDGIGCSLANL